MGTGKSRRSSLIRILPVEAHPCVQIPGGMVLGKVVCPSFEEPIGWIVRSAGNIPEDAPSPLKPYEDWTFLPTCGIEPVLSGFANQGALQFAVRQQYRRMYDRMPGTRRRLVAKGDDCEIDSMILKWCGIDGFWDDNNLSDDYSVFGDVLPDCNNSDYWTREWYGGGPGLSGVWYYVFTENPSLFIREVRKITEALLAKKLAKPPPPPKRRRAPKAKKNPVEEKSPATTDH